ncbi:ABC transporter ATP-binding protein [Thalassotalea agariperforans]
MLEVKNLTRKYNQFIAVNDVSFTVNKGEVIGLLGHNGAGKTTIMKMLSGFLEADSGNISFDGLSLSEHLKQIQLNLGYLPENLPVYPEMIVADYLDYAADLKGLKGHKKHAEIKRVIKATDISEKLLAPISQLSRGFKQRVGVAQAILGKPKLLILDEPTNGLDPKQTQHMRDLILDIAEEATVIISTHIMQEVEALCSRVLIVNSGALVVDASLEELKQSHQLLLETSLNQQAATQLKQINGVKNISLVQSNISAEGIKQYKVELTKDLPIAPISAAIAKYIIDKNESLYSLTPQKRDLETLFKEVNEQQYQHKESKNAA